MRNDVLTARNTAREVCKRSGMREPFAAWDTFKSAACYVCTKASFGVASVVYLSNAESTIIIENYPGRLERI